MAQSEQDQIRTILNRLATVDKDSQVLLTLASGIKESQKNLRFALLGAIKLIAALNANRTDLTALLSDATSASDAFTRNEQFKAQLRDLLNQAPSSQESQVVINQLKDIVRSERMIDNTNLAIPDNSVQNKNIRTTLDFPPPPRQSQGGFNWRSKSSKRKKGVKGTIKSSNTRRKLKTKTKSRTRRSKSKSSN